MKQRTNCLTQLLILLVAMGAASAKAQTESLIAPLYPEQIFVPAGYDANDNVQLVLYGVFKDICHQALPPQVKTDIENKRIEIQVSVYRNETCSSVNARVPYSLTVNLGQLPQGEYSLLMPDESQNLVVVKKISVADAVIEGADDFLYARVTEVKLSQPNESGERHLVLKGIIPNTCLQLSRVNMTVNSDQIFDLLPIMKVIPGRCRPTQHEFRKLIPIKGRLKGPVLLNIRSAGGQALLKVLDPKDL